MRPRPLLHRTARIYTQLPRVQSARRCLASSIPEKQEPPKSWLTQKVETSPTARRVFLGLTNLFGYGSPKQVAGRRAFGIYDKLAVTAPDKDREFWQQCMFSTSHPLPGFDRV
jgi:hypothetical protein